MRNLEDFPLFLSIGSTERFWKIFCSSVENVKKNRKNILFSKPLLTWVLFYDIIVNAA